MGSVGVSRSLMVTGVELSWIDVKPVLNTLNNIRNGALHFIQICHDLLIMYTQAYHHSARRVVPVDKMKLKS
jgi:hypothetical protein